MAKRMGTSIQLATVSALALMATSAWAQTAGTAPASPPSADTAQQGQVQEVIVTSERRSERLQDVPIAVSVVSANKLATDGITDITMIKAEVPGANVRSVAGYSLPYLRGVGSASKTVTNEAPVATYVDEVYYGTPVNILTFNNIQSLEVIKGPQGTLFGRNSTGGLFNITTLDPSFQPTGTVNIGYGNYESVAGNAYFSTGITDKLAADLAVIGSTQGQGYGKNLTTGEDVYRNDYNLAARTKLLYKPDSDTRVVFIADYDDQKNSLGVPGTPQPGSGLYPNSVYPVFSNNPYDVRNNVQPLVESREGGVSLNVSHDFNSTVRLKSITAYRFTDYELASDQDATAAPTTGVFETTHYQQITQEFQAQSMGQGPLSWTTGVFYMNYHAPDHTFLNVGPYGLFYNQAFTVNSVAAYAQGTYAITPDTNLTVGARYTYEARRIVGDVTDVYTTGLIVSVYPYTAHSLVEEKPSYRVSLDHKFTPDLMVYASFNTSFRSGGYSYVNVAPFLPETLTAYEVGAKSQLFDHRVTLNASGFYYDYKNIQVQEILPTGTLVANGAGAELYGLDADMQTKITNKLSLTGDLEVLHAAYTAFLGAPLGTAFGGRGTTVGSAAGKELPFAPNYTANLGLVYKTPVANGTLIGSVTSYVTSKYYMQADNAEFQNAYGSANGSVTWQAPTGFSVKVWANNIFNKVVLLNAVDSPPTGNHIFGYEPPRTFGATFGYHF